MELDQQQSQLKSIIAKGKECLAQNDYVGAISALREAADREPGYADVRHLLGLALGLAGQPEAALEEFDRAPRERTTLEHLTNQLLTRCYSGPEGERVDVRVQGLQDALP